MLRWLTAGESHGPALVGIIEGVPAGVELTSAAHQRGAGPPAARLRPRRPDEVRAGRGHDPRRRPPRPDPGRPGRHPGRQHRMAQVGNSHVLRSRRPGRPGRPGPQRPADPAAARPRRPHRHAEVRLRRRPPGPRAGQRPRDGHPGGAGRGRRGVPQAARDRARLAHRVHRPASPCRKAGRCRSRATCWPSTPIRCAASTAKPRDAMVAEVDAAHKEGETLGGVVEVLAYGLPPGLGSYVHWDRRLDSRLAGGPDGHPGHQGRRGRRRLPDRRPPRLGRPRRDRQGRGRQDHPHVQPRRRHRRRHEHRRRPARPRRHEADRHRARARSRPSTSAPGRPPRPTTSAPTSVPSRPPASWPRPWWPWCSPRPSPKNSAATPWQETARNIKGYLDSIPASLDSIGH